MAEAATGAKVPTKNPHGVTDDSAAVDFPMPMPGLVEVEPARRPSAAEEARTIAAGTTVGTLASLTSAGDPWASVVTYGLLEDGTPVLCVSTLALHGRNLAANQRASLAVSAAIEEGADPSDTGRVTFAGGVEEPVGAELEAARAAYQEAVPSAAVFSSFDDFTFWLLRVEQIRWVGGFGRMSGTSFAKYSAAEPDPVASQAAYAVRHMNEDHADALLAMARAVAGHTDAVSATCLRADRYGLDLDVETGRGRALARVGFAEPITERDGLRAATVELARRSRGD